MTNHDKQTQIVINALDRLSGRLTVRLSSPYLNPEAHERYQILGLVPYYVYHNVPPHNDITKFMKETHRCVTDADDYLRQVDVLHDMLDHYEDLRGKKHPLDDMVFCLEDTIPETYNPHPINPCSLAKGGRASVLPGFLSVQERYYGRSIRERGFIPDLSALTDERYSHVEYAH